MKKNETKILRYLKEHDYNDNLTDSILISSLNLTEYEYNLAIIELTELGLVECNSDINFNIKRRKITEDGKLVLNRSIIYRFSKIKYQLGIGTVLCILTFFGFDDPLGCRGRSSKQCNPEMLADSVKMDTNHIAIPMKVDTSLEAIKEKLK